MPNVLDAPAFAYQLAWIGVAALCVCYIGITFVVHWSSERKVGVTRYDPPQGISAGLAGYLSESGRCERAFAAALIALASKGYIEIQQQKDWFVLEKLREPDEALPPDESVIPPVLFSPEGVHTYKFNGREYGKICKAYKKFSETAKGIADPTLISAHAGLWWCGVVISCVILALVITSFPGVAVASLAYLGLWVLVGGSSLVAALRVWPATIQKLTTFLPGSKRRRRALDMNDAIPVILIGPILLGFSFLAYWTSLRFLTLAVALIIINFVFQHRLEAPTKEGRKTIAELENFREFLSRADADRLNRENNPGQTPEILEKYSAYAVALHVEHAWGEEFTANLLELLQFDQAYDVLLPKPAMSGTKDEIIQLNIDPRK
jgi:hypothetical protein